MRQFLTEEFDLSFAAIERAGSSRFQSFTLQQTST
jgi:hypothetical protein